MKNYKHDFSSVNHVLLDVDHVINHYGEEYARQFSVATALSFRQLYPDFSAQFDIEEIIHMAVFSYQTTGKTTTWFADKFGVDELELYRHHHDSLCEVGGYITKQFETGKIKTDPELRRIIELVNETGVKIHAFTNGTEKYAHTVLAESGHGISDLFETIMGMDSFENSCDRDKRHGAHIVDALRQIGRFENWVGVGKTAKTFDYSDVVMVDDTSCNLRACGIFNIHAVMPLRKNTNNEQDTRYANTVVKDVKDFFKLLVDAKKSNIAKPNLKLFVT